MRSRSPRRGLSLLEIAVVVTILGIVTGGAIAQISDGRVTNSDGRPIFLMGAVPGLVIGSSIGAVVAFTQD